MEPRSEKRKININVWSSAFRRSGSKRFANDPDQPFEGGTPNALWRFQAMAPSRLEVHRHPMSFFLNVRSVTPRTRPLGTNVQTTSPGGLEASSGRSNQGEKHGNANGSCLWNAGRRSEDYRKVPISRHELLLLLGRVQAEVRSTAAAVRL